ncbi:MAG: hypothetical protein WCY72_10955, partial [Lysobacteraceae bacterium]
TETITWITDGSVPDADMTVLAEVEDADGTEVWPAYYDGEKWVDATGWPIRSRVIAWADMPAGSRAAR